MIIQIWVILRINESNSIDTLNKYLDLSDQTKLD